MPTLPSSTVDPLLEELNTSRKFYTFVKKMRSTLRAQVEKQRLEARETARNGGH
jgi:kinetochore protein Spc25